MARTVGRAHGTLGRRTNRAEKDKTHSQCWQCGKTGHYASACLARWTGGKGSGGAKSSNMSVAGVAQDESTSFIGMAKNMPMKESKSWMFHLNSKNEDLPEDAC